MHLRSLDQNCVGIVRLYCVECCKEFGFPIGDHSKNTIHKIYAKKKLNNHMTSYIYEIGAKGKESNLMMIPNTSL